MTLPAIRTNMGGRDLAGPTGGAGSLAVERKDQALQGALEKLAPGAGLERADTPDGVITAVRRLAPVDARYAPSPPAIDPRLQTALERRGISQLYIHQAEAFAHIAAGRHIVVTTPTASGKTLCYNLPVLNAVLQNPAARALYLFPTKALAQDQMAELHELVGELGDVGAEPIGVHTYDGDTPADARRTIRTRAHVVLSNPDMLHSGILPHHPRWAKLFENLQFIVIDELHAYRGVFGSHLCNVLRRARRIAQHYGSDPQIICSSATIANPRELAERLAERPFELVAESGAPRGEKFFVFVNPPVVNRELGIRRSYLAETRRIAGEFLRRNLQAIVFAQSRLSTEILTTYLKEDFEDVPGMPEKIRGYRGGYLPLRRREIERGLRDGLVRGVVSTNALELGIDIGALDIAVLAGYPGTIASTWQRAGRAGRRNTRSAAVLVASSAPVDQFVVRHPSYFFDASPEHALLNPDNLHILVEHVKCAAFELPFTTDDAFGTVSVQDVLAVLQEAGLVHLAGAAGENTPAQWHWTSESYPADAVSLRSISSDNFVVVDQTHAPKVIAETDYNSGFPVLHPKAIYILEGRQFQVEKLDVEGRKAYVREVDCDYYTDAITYTRVTILDRFAADAQQVAHHGEVHVVSRVVGFKKVKFYTNENVGSGELDLPEQQMHTTSYWLEVPLELLSSLPYAIDDRRDGIFGLAFAMKQIASLLLMCDARDLGLSVNAGDDAGGRDTRGRNRAAGAARAIDAGGGRDIHAGAGQNINAGAGQNVSAGGGRDINAGGGRDINAGGGRDTNAGGGRDTNAGGGRDTNAGGGRDFSPADGDAPRIFLYDAYPGGIGFSEPLFSMHVDLLTRTRELIAECPCENGCPSCVGPVGQSGPLAKTVALRILDHLTQNQLRDVSSPRPMMPASELTPGPAGDLPAGDEMPF